MVLQVTDCHARGGAGKREHLSGIPYRKDVSVWSGNRGKSGRGGGVVSAGGTEGA